MQPSEAVELQSRIASRLAAELPKGWRACDLHYERLVWKGEPLEQYTSKCSAGSHPVRFEPSLECLDLLIELQQGMGQPGSETWSSVDIRLESSGMFKFSFGYGMPSLVSETLRSSGELP